MGRVFSLTLLVAVLLSGGLNAEQSQSGDARGKVVEPKADPKNPSPPYPVMSKQLDEEGKVILDVLVAEDGHVLDAKVNTSSGFDRLDHAAVQTVMQRWKFSPGKVGGVPQKMEHKVLLVFKLAKTN